METYLIQVSLKRVNKYENLYRATFTQRQEDAAPIVRVFNIKAEPKDARRKAEKIIAGCNGDIRRIDIVRDRLGMRV